VKASTLAVLVLPVAGLTAYSVRAQSLTTDPEKPPEVGARAEGQRDAALEAKAEAQQARARASRAEAEARRWREEARRNLYILQMIRAQQAWQEGWAERVQELLDGQRPTAGQEDFRGFEWYYLWRVCRSDRLTFKGHRAQVYGLAYSPDGRYLASASALSGEPGQVKVWDAGASALSGEPGQVSAQVPRPPG